ncbi:hypothetical protein [Sulfitobacter sediminilitoris]
MIQQQPKGTFATYVRGLTERAVAMSFPFFVLENLPRATKEEIEAIRQQCRDAYAEPWSPKVSHEDPPETDPPDSPPKNDPEDPLRPSPEL